MVDSTIIRPATEDEKKDFIEIGSKDFIHYFKQKVIAKQQEYTRKHVPFCFRCANLDFEDLVEQKKRELLRKSGYVRNDNKELMKIEIRDLDKYADMNRFELLNETEVVEYDKVHRPPVPYVTGKNTDYKCKFRGCGISVFTPRIPVNTEKAPPAK